MNTSPIDLSSLTSRKGKVLPLLYKYGGKVIGQQLAQNWQKHLALAMLGTAALAAPAHALKINFTYSSEVSLEAMQSLTAAASYWENTLKDPVTVNINFEFAALPDGALGGTKPNMMRVNYKDYLTALGQDVLSQPDILVVQSQLEFTKDQDLFTKYLNGEIDAQKFKVQDTKTFDVLLEGNIVSSGSSQVNGDILDNNGNSNNQKIWLSRANAKALGLLKADDSRLDGNMVLSSIINWDFNPNNGINSNATDFQTVVRHEIGHVLGFVSGTDAMEFINMSSRGTSLNDKDLTYLTPMNTLMYSQESAALKAFDLRSDVEKFMSIDGGLTAVLDANGKPVLFAGGIEDDHQNSHWQNSLTSPIGIMNPTLSQGKSMNASDIDLTLLDVIGWDRINLSEKLMGETGLDWQAFQQNLDNHRQSVVQTNAAYWALYNPTDSQGIAKELDEQLRSYYKDIDSKIEAILIKLKDDLQGENDPLKRNQKRTEAMEKIWKLVTDQDNKLQHFTEDMRDVNKKVRDWLDKSVTDLSKLLYDANAVQISKLGRILANATPTQRAIWEDKISQALALFLDNPTKALAEINKTNNFNSPIGWGGGGSWGGWWSNSVEDSTNDPNFYSYSTADSSPTPQDTESVPEPSAALGLLTLGVLGVWSRQKKS